MRTTIVAGLLVALATPASGQIDFTQFKDSAGFAAALVNLQTRFPSLARVITIGTSVEGRAIQGIKISDNVATSEPDEGAIILIGTQHAREWLAGETALFVAEQILERYATDATVHADVDQLEIYIVPIVNVDGFKYTWTPPPMGDRDWRKNRRLNAGGSYGVDLNRNWGFQWAFVPSPIDANGSYGNATETSIVYYGPMPFSEPEIQAVRDLANSLPNLKAFEDIHTYSELYLAPWRYTSDVPPGAPSLEALANRQVTVTAAVHGHTYTRNLYRSSGASADYIWNGKRAAAISPELRPPASAPDGGFAPPPTEIIPTGEEHLAAVLALMHDAAARHVWIRDYTGDTGVEPSATWTGAHWTHAFWESPDIWTTPTDLVGGSTVTLHVHVLNNTGAPVNGVVVEAYYNDPRITLDFPDLTSVLIGTQTVNVPPGGKTITMPWPVPAGTNSWGEYHWCVGVVVRQAKDMALTNVTARSSNVGMKNFQTTAALAGGGIVMTAASNVLAVAAELIVNVDSTHLPRGWRAEVLATAPRSPGEHSPGTLRKAKLLGTRGILLEPGEKVLVPVRVTPPRGAKQGATAEVRVEAALLPLVAGDRTPFGNGFTYRMVVDTTKCRCK
jgi:hypothetical protein